MRTFKEYLAEKRSSVLSWASGNAENRKPSILSWDSGFAESRDETASVTEEVTAHTKIDNWKGAEDSVRGARSNSRGAVYNADIHDHPDVKPKRLKHALSIEHYTTTPSQEAAGSSKNVNGYLRNKMGDKSAKVEHHTPEAVHEVIKKLSSNFTKENTNRKAVTTYSGIPTHIGEQLEASKKGDVHHLAGFTSTSTMRHTADEFSISPDTEVRHIIKFHVKPGAGLSVAAKSRHPENEIMLHHGAKTVYSHTEVNVGKSHGGARARNVETHIHHVEVHPEHLPLESYGSYDHPKD